MTPRTLAHRATAVSVATVAVAVAAVSGPAGPAAARARPAGPAAARPAPTSAAAVRVASRSLPAGVPSRSLPAGVPTRGRYAFLLTLDTPSTLRTFDRTRAPRAVRAGAARSQYRHIKAVQSDVIDDLPARTPVLYRLHSLVAAVGVTTDVDNYTELTAIPGVSGVYPIAPKSPEDTYAVPLQGAPTAWTNYGALGDSTSIAVIDSGIDYTHADFGGPGTVAAYQTALAGDGVTADPDVFPSDKVIGGYDFVGDDYNGGSDTTPVPDDNPLDCLGHGTSVAGSAAGLGENADGTTYTGDYDTDTPFAQMKIGPGMAPDAKLLAYKVFGCSGTTTFVGAALERAMDPNQDGNPSDHVDVVNLSLGSKFGSTDDGDTIMTDAAVDAGIEVVVSGGNDGNSVDVGSSPGTASKALTVANSVDAYDKLDSLDVTNSSGTGLIYGAWRATSYPDWATRDLAGPLVLPTSSYDSASCGAAPAGTYAHEVPVVPFDESTSGSCSSTKLANNLAAAGAVGYVLADSQEHLGFQITGSGAIPGVQVIKSAGDALRDALSSGGGAVTATGTSKNTYDQIETSRNDELSLSSSQGVHANGDVKPDVAAVGDSVFSAQAGTGSDGGSQSGTSAAAPMVAGLAADVISLHPDWTPEQVKADIVNTADQNVYDAPDHTGNVYPPNRTGSGRIDASAALANQVLAYDRGDPGSVSVSFGPVAARKSYSTTKQVTVSNESLSPVTYGLAYQAIDSVPGVSISVSPSSVTLDARTAETVTVTLTLSDIAAMTNSVAATQTRGSTAVPTAVLSDASGLIILTPADTSAPTLRLPVYSAPRPASSMTAPGVLTLGPSGTASTASRSAASSAAPSSSSSQSAAMSMTGTGLGASGHNGVTGGADDGDEIRSAAMGFELTASSGQAPPCGDDVTTDCWTSPADRAADIRYLGVTRVGDVAYFAIATWVPHAIPVGNAEFDVYLDTSGDGKADFVLKNTRYSGTGDADVFVSALYSVSSAGALTEVDELYLNGTASTTNTALYDSTVMVLPVSLGRLGITSANPDVRYGVEARSDYSAVPVDDIGYDPASGAMGLSANLAVPALSVTGSSSLGGALLADTPSNTLTVTRASSSYVADHGVGALLVHFHNLPSAQAQALTLRSTPSVGLTAAPSRITRGAAITATIRVSSPVGTPTGTVQLRNLYNQLLGTARLSGGTARISYRPPYHQVLHLVARYLGDTDDVAEASATSSVVIAKTTAKLTLGLSPRPGSATKRTTARVKVARVLGPATGTVTITRTSGPNSPKTVATGRLTGGAVTLRFLPRIRGSYRYQASYAGDADYTADRSGQLGYTTTR